MNMIYTIELFKLTDNPQLPNEYILPNNEEEIIAKYKNTIINMKSKPNDGYVLITKQEYYDAVLATSVLETLQGFSIVDLSHHWLSCNEVVVTASIILKGRRGTMLKKHLDNKSYRIGLKNITDKMLVRGQEFKNIRRFKDFCFYLDTGSFG